MHKCLYAPLTILLFAYPILAQMPTPTPVDDVVKISTRLIQVDVTVTDKKGKPIADLTREEIEIYENGEKQKITGFDFISGARPAVLAEKKKQRDASEVPPPPSAVTPGRVSRTMALVVDDLSLSSETASFTRRALRKFVDEQMQDGDLVAIVRSGGGIGALQQFTFDKRMLYAAIEKVRWNPQSIGGISTFAPIGPGTADDELSDVDTTGEAQSLEDFRRDVLTSGSLGALGYIVRGMSELPGRKSVILFSNGFELFERQGDGIDASGRIYDQVRVLIESANRAAITFYTIDARGVMPTFFTAADAPTSIEPHAMAASLMGRSAYLENTQEGLSYLARETGGLSLLNNNDINGGIRRVLNDQSYYLVAYEPDSETFDPKRHKYNQLSVKVSRKDAVVRYRSGFFNSVDSEKESVSSGAAKTPTRQLTDAITSPFGVNDIGLRLNALFGNDEKAGSYVRSFVHVDAHSLAFTDEADGAKAATIEILAMSFGDNGVVADQLRKSYTVRLRPDVYQQRLNDGFVYQFTFPVKKPGAYQYRIAVRDSNAGTVGSASQFIEVPNVKKQRLLLSSIIVQSVAPDAWQGAGVSAELPDTTAGDTALRKIKQNSVLRYGYEIYNSKFDAARQPRIVARIRVFRDGKLFYEGKDADLAASIRPGTKVLAASGALAIGRTMEPGDYVLQVIATDMLAKGKPRPAWAFVQFEVTQ